MKNASVIGNLAAKAFVLLLGLVLFSFSGYKLVDYAVFRMNAVAVDGVVAKPMGGRSLGARPLVAFTDRDGNVHEFRTRAKTSYFSHPKKGDKIRVLYSAGNPDIAIADRLLYHVLFPLVFCVLGAAAIFYVFKGGRREFSGYGDERDWVEES